MTSRHILKFLCWILRYSMAIDILYHSFRFKEKAENQIQSKPTACAIIFLFGLEEQGSDQDNRGTTGTILLYHNVSCSYTRSRLVLSHP